MTSRRSYGMLAVQRPSSRGPRLYWVSRPASLVAATVRNEYQMISADDITDKLPPSLPLPAWTRATCQLVQSWSSLRYDSAAAADRPGMGRIQRQQQAAE